MSPAKKLKRWNVYGTVTGGKFIGAFEAATAEEAMDKAADSADVSLCHQCSGECENAEIEVTHAEVDE